MQKQVDYIWHMVYDLLRGPAATKKLGANHYLSNTFDEDLLASIAKIGKVQADHRTQAIADVEGMLEVCLSTNLIADKDVAKILKELDKIETLGE